MEKKLDLLANKIVNYSLNIKENERVLINSYVDDEYFIIRLIKYIVENKGIPFVRLNNEHINNYLLENTLVNKYDEINKHTKDDMNNYDAFINIKNTTNDFNQKNIKEDILRNIGGSNEYSEYVRIDNKKWILINYPNQTDAYKAGMEYNEYKKYVFDLMTYNYDDMSNDIDPLKELMEKTNMVRIIGFNTDIEFSIKDMPVIKCVGHNNLPDGAVYTAPVRDSINGIITYNVPSNYNGTLFNNVTLQFENGKIINGSCFEKNKELEKILDIDEGARYAGEFALGLNPLITNPVGNSLYDKKIHGSLHLTPGQSNIDSDNGNRSSIHWELVLNQSIEYGGGEVYFDSKLVRKNGLFVLPELKHLNYKKK